LSRKPKITGRVKAKHQMRNVRALRRVSLGGSGGVKVGVPAGGANPYPDGTDVIDVAVANEFGTETIPERSFLRSAIRENKGAYKKLNRKHLKKIRKMTAEKALELLGTEAAGHVADKVNDVSTPPNAPSTRDRKGSENPLVDTGHLKQSITHEVIK